MGGFNNKEIAKRAGQVSKRGEQKVGIAAKRAVATFVEGKLNSIEMEALWQGLEGKDKVKLLLGLLPYVIRPVSVSPEEETQHSTIEVEFISKNDSIIITNNN